MAFMSEECVPRCPTAFPMPCGFNSMPVEPGMVISVAPMPSGPRLGELEACDNVQEALRRAEEVYERLEAKFVSGKS